MKVPEKSTTDITRDWQLGRRQLAIGNWRLAKTHVSSGLVIATCEVAKLLVALIQSSDSAGDNMKDFRELQVWQLAHTLVLAVYEITRSFPRDETYGLRIQVRRAAASIPENIAEGCGREGDGEFHRFLQIAAGSASELDYELLLARDLGFIGPADYERLQGEVIRVKKMLRSLVQKVGADRQAATSAR